MALPCSSQVGFIPSLPPASGNVSPVHQRTDVVLTEKYFQGRSKSIQQQLPRSIVSRRDAMAFMTASLGTAFFVTDPVEARNVKPETRRKIREKLDKIREKAGIPEKEKADSSSGNKEKPQFG